VLPHPGARVPTYARAILVLAVEDYRAAIKAAQEAAKALGNARRATEWVADFDAGQAKVGGTSPYSGGTLRVKGAGVFRGEHVVVDVLKLCEQGAEQPESKQLVTSRVGR
jgi:hypothetical protein